MAKAQVANDMGNNQKESPMKGDKYHLFKLPMGWMVLLGGQRGLKRASLKPSPQEGLEDLGRALDDAKEDTGVFDDIILSLIHI